MIEYACSAGNENSSNLIFLMPSVTLEDFLTSAAKNTNYFENYWFISIKCIFLHFICIFIHNYILNSFKIKHLIDSYFKIL